MSALAQGDHQIATCSRCGERCKVADAPNPNAQLLRKSTTAEGLCANCAVTQWFVMMNERGGLPDFDPKQLLWKPIQEQFGRLMQAGNADMKPAEINWAKVVEHWALPFPKAPKPKRARRK